MNPEIRLTWLDALRLLWRMFRRANRPKRTPKDLPTWTGQTAQWYGAADPKAVGVTE